MKGLDTHILIRYLTRDDEIQANKVKKLFKDKEASNEKLFVSLAVALEIMWVLKSGYHLENGDILDSLKKLIGLSFLKFEHENSLLELIAHGENGDLSDQLIGLIGKSSGCSSTITFDKVASKLETFELLK